MSAAIIELLDAGPFEQMTAAFAHEQLVFTVSLWWPWDVRVSVTSEAARESVAHVIATVENYKREAEHPRRRSVVNAEIEVTVRANGQQRTRTLLHKRLARARATPSGPMCMVWVDGERAPEIVARDVFNGGPV